MAHYKVCLEGDKSGYMAHILSLPGCTAFGHNEKFVLRNLKEASNAHLEWLKKQRYKVAAAKEVVFEIAERVTGTSPWLSGSAAALFLPDLIPPTKSEIKEYLKLLRFSRKDLLSFINQMPPNLLDYPLQKKRTIRQVLNHIANAEWWYLSRIAEWSEIMAIPEKVPKDKILFRMQWIRKAAYRILPRLAQTTYHQIYIPSKYCNKKLKEPWTARKVLRRFIEHEREHYFNIQDLLNEIKRVG